MLVVEPAFRVVTAWRDFQKPEGLAAAPCASLLGPLLPGCSAGLGLWICHGTLCIQPSALCVIAALGLFNYFALFSEVLLNPGPGPPFSC